MYFTRSLVAIAGLAACASAAPPNFKRGAFDGISTFYYTSTGASGSCGDYLNDNDFIVALPSAQMSSGNYCNRMVRITNTQNGNTQVAQVKDTCPGCNWGSLDMSPSLFNALSSSGAGEGTFSITWDWA